MDVSMHARAMGEDLVVVATPNKQLLRRQRALCALVLRHLIPDELLDERVDREHVRIVLALEQRIAAHFVDRLRVGPEERGGNPLRREKGAAPQDMLRTDEVLDLA